MKSVANDVFAPWIRVFVDGQDVTDVCVAFSEEDGFAVCLLLNSNGHLYLDPNSPNGDAAKETRYGRVAVALKDGVSAWEHSLFDSIHRTRNRGIYSPKLEREFVRQWADAEQAVVLLRQVERAEKHEQILKAQLVAPTRIRSVVEAHDHPTA